MSGKAATEKLEKLPEMLDKIEELLNENNTPAYNEMCAIRARTWVEYIQLLITIKSGAEIDLEHLANGFDESKKKEDDPPLC
jgi:hypothetical protein